MRARVAPSLHALAAVLALVVVTSCGGSATTVLAGAGRDFMASVELDRPATGVADVEIGLRRHHDHGAPADGVRAVFVSSAMPDMGHVTPELPAQQVGPGRFRVRGELFPMPGRWELDIRVESTDGSEVIRIGVLVEGGGSER